jgi:hypothetical protein
LFPKFVPLGFLDSKSTLMISKKCSCSSKNTLRIWKKYVHIFSKYSKYPHVFIKLFMGSKIFMVKNVHVPFKI